MPTVAVSTPCSPATLPTRRNIIFSSFFGENYTSNSETKYFMQLYIFGDNFQYILWHSCMLCHFDIVIGMHIAQTDK